MNSVASFFFDELNYVGNYMGRRQRKKLYCIQKIAIITEKMSYQYLPYQCLCVFCKLVGYQDILCKERESVRYSSLQYYINLPNAIFMIDIL